ncbi:hypothetical protein pdam_00012445 [Pocillopora damicornis]|uniref:PiggyBac transposable element-derived protein domain-containing protein n=1 Tax=Pocillopora damicornis TaxID=46731 RepID=A0A3M6TBG5_POCDA|nr:hypothetical protein pdam_00012445 [Pocillopora damicornis]
MAANIVFVDEGTVGEVVGGEDSDFDENTDNYESSVEEGDRREEDSDDEEESEEESEEDNWVLGDRIPRRLDFTADRGFNVKLPNNPSFSNYFHLLFSENLFDEIVSQTYKYATETRLPKEVSRRLNLSSSLRSLLREILGTGKKSNITQACVVCFPAQEKILKRTGDKRKRPGKESSFQWSVCKALALCMQDCFQLYHTVEDL